MRIVMNGLQGSRVDQLLANGLNPCCLRPFLGEDGRTYITVVKNGKLDVELTNNTTATLRKDEWKMLDDVVIQAARPRLKLVAALNAAGLVYNIPNGMAKTVLETQAQSDVGDATISMDALREGANDRPEFDLTSLPLPIIHKDFQFSLRQIATSRNGGSPLDTIGAETAARKVAEEVEKLTCGSLAEYNFGGGVIYGLRNYPNVITGVITSPEGSSWTPAILVTEILAMRQQAYDAYHYGPFTLNFSHGWDKYLDEDFKDHSDITLRERLALIDGISSVVTLDYLDNYDVCLLQMTSDVMRMVNGMPISTIQWETHGGMLVHFKVMTIQVPQPRKDFNDNTGIVFAAVA